VQFNRPSDSSVLTDVSLEAIEQRVVDLKAGFDHLPLGEVMLRLAGEDLELYQSQLEHASYEDPYWAPSNFRAMLSEWTVPTLLIDGWHDYPLPVVLDDYAVLRRSSAPVRLRIGAGGHLGGGGEGGMTDAPLDWFDTYLRDQPGLLPEGDVALDI
jgi:predicted acyl esterase